MYMYAQVAEPREFVTETLPNGSTIEYKIVNGTAYHKDTPMEVVAVLEASRQHDIRIRLFYGDVETGRDWMEEYETMGRVGRSVGPIKIPILLKQRNSNGGTAILDDCIVKITAHGETLYQHPKYHQPSLSLRPCDDPEMIKLGYTTEVLMDDKVVARFATEAQAQRWISFMKGERNSK